MDTWLCNVSYIYIVNLLIIKAPRWPWCRNYKLIPMAHEILGKSVQRCKCFSGDGQTTIFRTKERRGINKKKKWSRYIQYVQRSPPRGRLNNRAQRTTEQCKSSIFSTQRLLKLVCISLSVRISRPGFPASWLWTRGAISRLDNNSTNTEHIDVDPFHHNQSTNQPFHQRYLSLNSFYTLQTTLLILYNYLFV